jgi:hypothetical protein
MQVITIRQGFVIVNNNMLVIASAVVLSHAFRFNVLCLWLSNDNFITRIGRYSRSVTRVGSLIVLRSRRKF